MTETITVYGIRCERNGRIYVGSTKDFTTRVFQHLGELHRNEKTAHGATGGRVPSQWQKDYNKYGEDSFKIYILEEGVSPMKRKEREEFWINKYRATEPEYGYNYRATVRRPELQPEKELPPFPPEKEDES